MHLGLPAAGLRARAPDKEAAREDQPARCHRTARRPTACHREDAAAGGSTQEKAQHIMLLTIIGLAELSDVLQARLFDQTVLPQRSTIADDTPARLAS